MKIHNPNNLEFDAGSLRALARGELDPVRQAVEDHKEERRHQQQKSPHQDRRQSTRALKPAGSQRAANKESPRTDGHLPAASGRSAGNNNEVAAPPHQKSRDSAVKKEEDKLTEEQRREQYETLRNKQFELTEIIRECEALEVLDFDLLALKSYPDGLSLSTAKRRRDLWLLCCLFCLALILLGWQGMIAPWIAGMSLGVLILLGTLMIRPIRKILFTAETVGDLKQTRKTMEFRALNHIKMLEGSNGLAYQCQMMLSFRPSLAERRFQRIVMLSQQSNLIKAIRSVAGIRLYLTYLVEAQQAYRLVKQEYMKTASLLKREFADFTLQNT